MFVAKTMSGANPEWLVRRIVKNSVTLNVGDCVLSYANGVADVGLAGAPILGIVIGFEKNDGTPLIPSSPVKGTTTYKGSVDQLVAASDNQTVAKYVAVICADPSVTWSAQVNGTINTTVSSSLPGFGIDVDSANTNYGRVLETTATRTAATITNFYAIGNMNGTSTDPDDSTRLLVKIQASEVFSSKKG